MSPERREIVALLQGADGPMSPTQIADALGKNVSTVKTLVRKMVQANQIMTPGRGGYALIAPVDRVNRVDRVIQLPLFDLSSFDPSSNDDNIDADYEDDGDGDTDVEVDSVPLVDHVVLDDSQWFEEDEVALAPPVDHVVVANPDWFGEDEVALAPSVAPRVVDNSQWFEEDEDDVGVAVMR